MKLIINAKSRIIAGRTNRFVQARYGDVIESLEPQLDKFENMPVSEPMVRRRTQIKRMGDPILGYHKSDFRFPAGRKPRTWRDS